MGTFAARFKNRKVAETYICDAVKAVVENCDGIGIPRALETTEQV